MKGALRCPKCKRTAPAAAMWCFPHEPGCEGAQPGSLLEYNTEEFEPHRPWPTWDWPKRTNSYRLEMRGYEEQQRQLRFSAAPLVPVRAADRHRIGRFAHWLGRKGLAA